MEKAALLPPKSRSREVVQCGLSIAFITISAWITVPFGPIPFTLQTLAIMLTLFVLSPRAALLSIGGYLLLGAVGLPVFSSFKGGLAALLGPTGGFIGGFFVGAAVSLSVCQVLKRIPVFNRQTKRNFFGSSVQVGALLLNIVKGIIFLAVLYVFGWAQLMVVGNLSPEAAFLAAVAPFVVIDAVKLVAACMLAQAVNGAPSRCTIKS